MRMKLFILLSLLFITKITSQVNFGEQQIISDNAMYANSVFAADIDGDNFIDLISASDGDDKVAWYKSTNGQGDFGTQQIITSNLESAKSIYAIDIDGDNDIDVISSSSTEVVWFENIDGEGSFNQHLITTSVSFVKAVFAIDLDQDGDIDIISASRGDDKIAWYENINGEGQFGSQQIISTNADAASSVFAIDIDGDNDIDVISSSSADGKIAWYENTNGEGQFGEQQVITTVAGALDVSAGDIDNDGDIDIVSGSVFALKWYENTDGEGNFIIHTAFNPNGDGYSSTCIVDIDGDGDLDLVSRVDSFGKIVYHENTNGLGNFNIKYDIGLANIGDANSIFPIDINNNGRIDVVLTSFNHVTWFENLGNVVNVNDSYLDTFNFYPNPTNNILTIKSRLNIIIVEVYNNLGQRVLSNNNNNVNLSALGKGFYFVKIVTDKGKSVIKKIMKK